MTIREALIQGTARLRSADIETPSLDTALFLAFILKTTREKLILHDGETLSEAAAAEFVRALDRRIAGECAAYILGHREFRGLDFLVTPDVLVPRPDTETLVDAALAIGDGSNLTVLDLCTGSGAVAIALKHELPSLEVYASDISAKALAIARENAIRLLQEDDRLMGGEAAIHFLEGDLFDPVPSIRFSLIVANPPYVASGEIPGLSREVRGEPLLALDGGEDGLDLVRRIVEGAPAYLRPGGKLLLEADPRQMTAIALILGKKGYRDIKLYQDLSGQDRVIEGAAPPG
jgi:release factor glutamine methyltransferase